MSPSPGQAMPALAYEALVRALEGVPGAPSAAECDGVICGVLSGPREVADEEWLAEVLGEAPGAEPAERCRSLLLAIRDARRPSLASPDMDFAPLLPGDAEPLEARSEALGQWCEGFLLGVALGGLPELSALPGDAREVIEDLSRMTAIDAGDAGGESDEADFVEVIEYIRMGVLLLHDELRGTGGPRQPGTPLH